MNPKLSALSNKIKGVGKKVADIGGDYIANRVMLRPGLDRMRGEDADAKRQYLQTIASRKREQMY